MNGRMRVLVGAVVLPLLTAAGLAFLITARQIGGMAPLPALLGMAGLVLCLAATVAGAIVFGLPRARADA